MKSVLFFVLTALMIAGCDNNDIDGLASCKFAELGESSAAVTISQGVYGLVSFTEGNCMPGIGMNNSCRTCPVKRTVRFYETTNESDAVRTAPAGSFYNSFKTRLVAETESDLNGFYQLALPPGNYTMVVVEDGKLYASYFDGSGAINPVSVSSGKKRVDFSITYKAVY